MPRTCSTLDQADAAETAAVSIGVPYRIAVVDAGGHLLALARQDRALIGGIDLAINKARFARLRAPADFMALAARSSAC